jgi:hypothetical protein
MASTELSLTGGRAVPASLTRNALVVGVPPRSQFTRRTTALLLLWLHIGSTAPASGEEGERHI